MLRQEKGLEPVATGRGLRTAEKSNPPYRSTTLDQVLSAFACLKSAGKDRWIARCSAHDDRSPSLSISLTSDQKILLHCFAGCDVESIVMSAGLRLQDLFLNSDSSSAKEWKRGKHREIYEHEQLVLQIYNSDKAKGKPISSTDLKRVTLAQSRVKKLHRLWGGAP